MKSGLLIAIGVITISILLTFWLSELRWRQKKAEDKRAQEHESEEHGIQERLPAQTMSLRAGAGPKNNDKVLIVSAEIKELCSQQLYQLGKLYDSALSARLEYEAAFFAVMDILQVSKDDQIIMLERVMNISELNGIPFHKLSPVNQFLTTSAPYIWYYLERYPPTNYKPEIIENIINSDEFTAYLNQLARRITQKVKGALWKPGMGWLWK